MLALAPNPALTSGAPAPLTLRVGGADSAQRRDAVSCPRCGIVGAHTCAFAPLAPAACCVVCVGHGMVLAGHAPNVARILPAREAQ